MAGLWLDYGGWFELVLRGEIWGEMRGEMEGVLRVV